MRRSYNTARRIQDLETREGQVEKLLEESASLRRLLESSEEELKRRLDFSQYLSAVKSQLITDRNPHKSASLLYSTPQENRRARP